MFDVGWSEFFLIIVVIVVLTRPDDLPVIVRYFKMFSRRISLLKMQTSQFLDKIEEKLDIEDKDDRKS